jgi:hypothetical protein
MSRWRQRQASTCLYCLRGQSVVNVTPSQPQNVWVNLFAHSAHKAPNPVSPPETDRRVAIPERYRFGDVATGGRGETGSQVEVTQL